MAPDAPPARGLGYEAAPDDGGRTRAAPLTIRHGDHAILRYAIMQGRVNLENEGRPYPKVRVERARWVPLTAEFLEISE
jgi:hypothetical protein